MKTTVRELMKEEVDIDVYDNVCEDLAIAFCGPVVLTDEGQKRFGSCLDYEVEIDLMDGIAIVDVDDKEGIWQKKLHLVKELFDAMAGYCASSDYDKWFEV